MRESCRCSWAGFRHKMSASLSSKCSTFTKQYGGKNYSGMMALVTVCLNTRPLFLNKLQSKPMSFVVRWLIRFKLMRFQRNIHGSTAVKKHVCRPRWTPIPPGQWPKIGYKIDSKCFFLLGSTLKEYVVSHNLGLA